MMYRTLLVIPMGQFQMFCLTCKPTQTAPVMKPEISSQLSSPISAPHEKCDCRKLRRRGGTTGWFAWAGILACSAQQLVLHFADTAALENCIHLWRGGVSDVDSSACT